MSKKSQVSHINLNAIIASIIAKVGCVTVVSIGIAFGAGLLLDRLLGTDTIFTVVLMIGSVPVTLYLVVRVSMSAAADVQREIERDQQEKEAEEETRI